MLSALCTLYLTGCGDKYKNILADDKVQAKNEEVRMPEREEDTEEARIPGREEDTGEARIPEREADNEKAESDEKTTITCQVENPGWEYYFAGEENTDGKEYCAFNLFSEEKLPEDAEAWSREKDSWFAGNGLERPQFPYSDEAYRYELVNGLFLRISDAVIGKIRVEFDFSEFQYGDIYKEECISIWQNRKNRGNQKSNRPDQG